MLFLESPGTFVVASQLKSLSLNMKEDTYLFPAILESIGKYGPTNTEQRHYKVIPCSVVTKIYVCTNLIQLNFSKKKFKLTFFL